MQVYFKTDRLKQLMESKKDLTKKFGAENSSKIALRLTQLRAAPTLKDMYNLPGIKCHELEGDKKGLFAVSIKDPHRIVFNPDHDPVPTKKDGGIDLKQVTRICITNVMDYH